ncbi:MAG TPA: GtrA family protein [Mesorhizobium sp.]|jgi:putative flippase GtrA|nr:GtrA family protein [Mesorhizobium sp.]
MRLLGSSIGRLFRFGVVGACASLMYAALAAGATRLGLLEPAVASTLIYCAIIPFAYLAHKRFTFQVERAGTLSFPAYAALQVATIVAVSVVTIRLINGHFARDALIYLMTAGVASVLSFLLCQIVIFKRSA